ncbi:MAG TPA: RidA family protein [Opitutaceae bacterium]|nr:RidA family protein [Opitutaceae bacterium]
MKTNLIETTGVCRLELRAAEHNSFTEFYLTATVDGAMRSSAAAEYVFEQVAATLVDRRIQPLQEKLYGLTGARPEVLKLRDAIYRRHGLERTMPVTWIQGTPFQGCDFAGLQVWGIAPSDGEKCVSTVENRVTGRGRLWTGRGFRILHLPGVLGAEPDGALARGPVAQAAQMFSNARAGLAAHGMKYTNVVRTWIYVARLLEWYGELNRVRTSYYRNAGLGLEGGPAFPASTGIMGHCDDEECLMDVLALESDGPASASAIPITRSPRQDSSFNYGSAFSRGMALEIEGRRTVHISGTASINAAGACTHVGDAEHQSLDTLMSIAAILADQGGGLHSITSATLFCKNRAAWEAWERAARLLQIPAFPKVCVLGDVCRNDLLVEMESVAVI